MSMQTYDVVIVGAGQAGSQVALELRDGGFAGSIALIGGEPHAPYDRPPLSKAFLSGDVEISDLSLHAADRWMKSEVDLYTGRRVVDVDPSARAVTVEDGERFGFEHLVWAAGGSPRQLPVPGAEYDGVHVLRTVDDGVKLREHARTVRSAAIIGGGYIGLEVAATLRKLGLEVTVIEATERVLNRVTSPEISTYFTRLHRQRGVDIIVGAGVTEISGANGRATGVRLSDGEEVAADLVVVGVGIVPEVGPLLAHGIAEPHGVPIDAHGRTGTAGIYAVGDCAVISNRFTGGKSMRIESVQNAAELGRVVAATIQGEDRPQRAVPWFWSNQYDTKLKTMGVPIAYDEVIVRGDPEGDSFSVVYLREGCVAAIDTVNNLRDYAQAKQLVESARPVDLARLAAAEVPLKELLADHQVAHAS